MKVEFYRPAPEPSDDPDAEAPPRELVGSASRIDGEPVVESGDEELRAALVRAYRKTPVVTDDASYRRFGTHGEVLIHPGDLEWFRAASFVRAPAETGLEARLVPGVTEGGFDPAAGYRRFEETIERLYT
ncbi:MAG TPA: hypothetical protein VJ979_06460 [Actinomycetota bacterium]|nr:hypothetical protein [Actinomycetota bacterium]